MSDRIEQKNSKVITSIIEDEQKLSNSSLYYESAESELLKIISEKIKEKNIQDTNNQITICKCCGGKDCFVCINDYDQCSICGLIIKRDNDDKIQSSHNEKYNSSILKFVQEIKSDLEKQEIQNKMLLKNSR